MHILIDYVSSNANLIAALTVSFLIALVFIGTARRAIVRDRSNFITVPKARSCFDCDDHFVVAPTTDPSISARVDNIEETVLRCRKMLQDEVRLSEQHFQDEWSFAYEQPPGDWVAVADKCPKFTLIQGGKKD